MRIIKFRGKTKDGEWIYYEPFKEALPNTISQFTGSFDKNGKEVYENDIIINVAMLKDDVRSVVVWDHNTAGWACDHNGVIGGMIESRIEVIGNIIDNPELVNR